MEFGCILAGTGLLFAACYYYYYYLTCTHRYWRERSVPCVDGVVPGFGNVRPMVLMTESIANLYQEFYNEMPGCSMVGFYNCRQPGLVLRDPELVKDVLVKNFSSFDTNEFHVDAKLDPLLAANPFFTEGSRWRAARQQLASAFTGGKLKFMYASIEEIFPKMTRYLNERIEKSGGSVELELKALFSRFTAEAVASAGFGIEGDSFEGDERGSFHEMGVIMLEPSFTKGLKQLCVFFIPSLGKLLRIRLMPLRVDQFFRRVVNDVLRIREERGIERNDFLQLMIKLRKSSGTVDPSDDTKFDETTITANATSFFIDGYETSSITLSFVGYQLAIHGDVQQRVREEVNSVTAKHNGLTYEAIQEMTYMDQVIHESMRLHPALGFLVKICTKEIDLEGPDGIVAHMTPGTPAVIPVQALHTDPRYWPNPQIFDPERFSEENKQERHKCVFLPFGEGPRACVGTRMAMMQMKAAVAVMLQNYTLKLSAKTRVPIQMDPNYFLSAAKGGLWVHLTPL